MPAAFTITEKEKIRDELRASAMRHAQMTGLKKTTVDLLAEQAGISKGAFYHFYDSKEALFLDMLEQWHGQIAHHAKHVFETHAHMEITERVALTFYEAVKRMAVQPLSRFLQQDVPMLLRRLPENLLQEHYQSDDDFIRTLIRLMQIKLKVEEDVAVAAIRIIFLSLISMREVGEYYDHALKVLIESACCQLIDTNC